MNEQENFDDLIRQKFAEKEFVFNEENWEKAEKKIDSTRRFRKIYLWTSIFIIGLFIGVGITLLLVGKDDNENKKNVSEIIIPENNKIESLNKENLNVETPNSSISSSGLQNENSSPQETDEKEIPSETKSNSATKDDQKLEKESSASTSTNIPAEKLVNKNAKISSPTVSNDPKNITTPIATKAKKKKKISNSDAKLIADKTISPNKQITKTISKESEATESNTPAKAEDNSIVLEKSSAKNNDAVSETKVVQTEKLNNVGQTTALNTEQNKQVKSTTETITNDPSELNSQKNNQDAALNPITQGKELVNESKSENAQVAQNNEQKISSDTNSTTQTEIVSPEKEIVSAKLDSSIVSTENKSTPPTPAAPGGLASATFFSVNAGTNFEFGWQYPDATEAGGFNPILGIGITHYLNQKWSLQSGVEYGSIAYLNSQKVFTNTTYGFGSTSVDTVVHTKMLHYAVVPLLFQYHFNDKNAICFGGSISYLVNSKSKITINTTTIAPMVLDSNQTSPIENQTTSTNSMETGYYSNAFNKWDASLAIGYRRRISQKFGIAAIANIGLLDVKNNAFFSQEQFERNVGLKIIISYDLFEF